MKPEGTTFVLRIDMLQIGKILLKLPLNINQSINQIGKALAYTSIHLQMDVLLFKVLNINFSFKGVVLYIIPIIEIRLTLFNCKQLTTTL